MKLKHLFALAAIVASGSAWAQQAWTDVTSKITNPSFETDNAIADLTTCGWATDRVTGWTILPASASNAQVGVGNSSSKLQGGAGTSSAAAAGEKFFYTRNNWNGDVNFSVEQTISSNVPAGLYMLTLKIKAASSDPAKTKYTISLQEGDKTAVTNTNAGSAAEWLNCGVLINKTEDNTSLTIKANMLPGNAANSQHYIMMIDDVQLKYLSTSDIENLSPENTLDVSGVIYNAGIYNANKANMPRGWTAFKSTRGNSNFTEGTGDTRLEGWSGGDLDIDYYQQIAGLPAGKYRMTATCGDSNDKGAYAYIYNAVTSEKVTVDMGSTAADITTPSIIVNDGNAINIGIAGDNLKNGSWVTGDNFRLEYLGTGVDLTAWNAAKADAEAALAEYNEKYATTERAAVVAAKDAANPTTDEEVATKTADLNTKIATYRTKAANEKLMEEKKPLTDAIARIETEYPNSSDEVLNTDLSKWTTSTYVVMNAAEHWSGAKSYKYYEQSSAQWGQNSWSIYAEQTVNLPVGKYAFVVTARAAAETTTKMTVNGTEYELCHKGSAGYGIATDGEATFDMSKTYANNNAGRGWEYAYAEFEITEAKDVTFRFDASTSTEHNWVSIANPVLYYNDDAKDAMELVRKNAIIDQIADVLGEEDANVPTGKMNAEVATALTKAVAAAKAGSTTNTVDELTGFKSALETAIANANTSVANYAKVEPYNTKAEGLDAAGQAAYTETLAAYNNGTLTKDGEEAQAKAAYIAAVKAQTTENAVFTDVLNNPSFEDGTNGWTNNRNTTDTYDYKTVTDGPADGTKVLNAWAQQVNYINVLQKQTLPAGHYTLSAKVRTNAEPLNTASKNTQVRTYVNGKMTSNSESLTEWRTENWNTADAWVTLTTEFRIAAETEVEMGIYSSGENLANNSRGWFQVDDFQLIRVDDKDTEVTIAVTDAKWATFIAPFDVTIPAGIEAYSCEGKDDNDVLTLVQVKSTIPANKPVILNAAEPASETQYGKNVATEDEYTVGWLTGTHVDKVVGKGKYMLAKKDGKVGFYPTNEGRVNKAGKAYLAIPASVKADALFFPGDADAIMAIEALTSGKAEIYDLSGKKLNTLQKGINIVNGKKIMVK